jgi:hypothetical protein
MMMSRKPTEKKDVKRRWCTVQNFGPPTDDEPFRYEFAAPLGT